MDEEMTRVDEGRDLLFISFNLFGLCVALVVSLSLSRVCVFYLFYLFIYKEIEEEEKGAVVMAAIDPAPLTFSCFFFRGKLKMTLEKKKKRISSSSFLLTENALQTSPVVFTYLINK